MSRRQVMRPTKVTENEASERKPVTDCPATVKMREVLSKAIRPSTELKELQIPSRERLLGDWFMECDLGFIFAPRGLGKTWLVLAVAAALSNGSDCGPWRRGAKVRVLYVDGEMPCESIRERIEGLDGAENLMVLNHEALFHLAEKTLNLADIGIQEALTEWLLLNDVKVLILDNLSCLFSGVKENEADAWECILRWLLSLRRNRIAVVIVAHSGRNKEMRGTSRREDAAFWIIRLDEVQGDEREGARFISRFTKDRNSKREQPSTKWEFRTDPEGRVSISTSAASPMDVFRQWIEDGLTSAEDIAREMGCSKGQISKLAKRGISEGWLRKNGRLYALA